MNVDQLVSPQVRSLEPDTDEGANGMHEVTEGLFGVFVEQEDVDAQPPVPDGRMMPMTQREEEGGIPQQTMTVTIDAPPSSTGEAVRQTAAALALPMKHRHHLTPDVVQRASSLASSSGVPTAGSSREHNDGLSHHKSNASPLNDDDRSAAELRNTVPEPRGPNPSPGMQALGASLRGSIQNVGDGGGPKHRSPRLPEVPPISTLLQPMPFPGVQRSDVDDALIMQHLLERHRKMRLAAMRTHPPCRYRRRERRR
ncbi:Hypothetical protein, putative [Bodo saltans]|uniref:Uncharacterized protein n=1 Tax=Bodo saltans TaxID=75058 RepID=A0A0S4J464_BODSA|nr:Hypothetical protein, putative [Bodo saltans]|eukprot:CUG86155.1 Hypothetical protein, putative [Bodo saltans]